MGRRADIIHDVLVGYKKWKFDNPDEGYQYDEIHEFLADFSRGDLYEFMDWVEELFSKTNKHV